MRTFEYIFHISVIALLSCILIIVCLCTIKSFAKDTNRYIQFDIGSGEWGILDQEHGIMYGNSDGNFFTVDFVNKKAIKHSN